MSSNNLNHGEYNGVEQNDYKKMPETEKMLEAGECKKDKELDEEEDKEDILRNFTLTDDTSCGIWILRGPWLQIFANKKAYVLLYGLLGCAYSATYAYFNGTITTLEKRFKIPTRTTGIISIGNDISQLFASIALSYYASRGHRPRWVAIGSYFTVIFCLLAALPHFIYGSGENALSLTLEYGSTFAQDATTEVLELQKSKTLCQEKNATNDDCEISEGTFAPQVILFIAQLIAGVGGSLYYTLGMSYMDDNIKKSKTPVLISFSYFLRMLGPALGYVLASMCLKYYISPTLNPTIIRTDPRWLGAWWLGWLILSIPLFLSGTLLGLFPKSLPRAAARKLLAQEKLRAAKIEPPEEERPSFKDMIVTCKRLFSNVVLMLNILSGVFYIFGYNPYWIFMPKYIEMQYRQSASVSSLVTGTTGLVFSAVGVLVSGLVISRYKPRARYLVAWNIFVGVVSVMGITSYAFLGCAENDKHIPVLSNGELETGKQCNENCHCDYVKYSPVCSEDGMQTFISACHAGCRQQHIISNGSKLYTECACIKPTEFSTQLTPTFAPTYPNQSSQLPLTSFGGIAVPGSCPVDCTTTFYMFLAVVCTLKLIGATARASSFLVCVRCVEEKDKSVSMGLNLAIINLFAFVPSPIIFGYIMDKTCLVWGKTCTGQGNCWLYNAESLRNILNFTAAAFVAISTLIDVAIWYYVKDLKIFDEEIEMKSKDETENDI